jgi:hypothetical protein
MQWKRSSYPTAFVAVLIVLAVAVPVSATPLPEGSSVSPEIFTDDPGMFLAYKSENVAPISLAYTGLLTTAVYRDATGGIEFDYQFINNGPDDVRRLTGFNFAGFTTNVGFRLTPPPHSPPSFSAGAVMPQQVDRDADGSTVGFDFTVVGGPASLAINAGEASMILVIKTNASDTIDGFASVINGGAQTVPSFQPTGTPIPPAEVPEPATLLLVGSAVIGMGAAVRRRDQR